MNIITLLNSLLLSVPSASAPPLQDLGSSSSGDAQAAGLAVPRDRLHFRPDLEGALWVRGRTYKASAAADGFSYVPFLGSDAPRNMPVHFTLTQASLAGNALSLTPDATVRQVGNRFVLDRGAVEVRYDLGLESVEQSFVVDAAGASGPLDLVLSVQSELEIDASPSPDHAALRFDGARGGVRYGAATVLDGAGRSRAISTWFNGQGIHLTVPADFLRQASGPIVVDPVITTYGVSTILGDQRDVDMAYDQDSDMFLYVFEELFSSSDLDVIVMQRRATDGVFTGSAYMDLSSSSFKDPSVANLRSADRSLVVATRTTPVSGSTGVIAGAFFDHPAGLGPTFFLDGGGTFSSNHPDVGGCASDDPSSVFMVIWDRYYHPTDASVIAARSVAADGTLGPVEILTPFPSSGGFVRPAITKTSGHTEAPDSWRCAYLFDSSSPGLLDRIRAMEIDRNTDVLQDFSVGPVPHNATLDSFDIAAAESDGESTQYAIITSVAHEDTGWTYELTLELFGGVNGPETHKLADIEHLVPDRHRIQPHIATQDGRFMITYIERIGNATTAFLTALDHGRFFMVPPAEVRNRLGFMNGASHLGGGVAIATKHGGGGFGSRLSGLAWESAGANQTDLIGVTHQTPTEPALGSVFCTGNPNSTGERGHIAILGDQSLVSPKTLVAGAIPPGALGMFIVSDSYSAGPGSMSLPNGLCLGSSIGRVPGSIGSASIDGRVAYSLDPTAIPLPGGPVAATLGSAFYFQLWHRDVVGGVSSHNFTNTAQLYFIP